jgi:hypothetical protein
MNEHGFTEAVTSKLPSDVHVQSMTLASVSHTGTPDRYFDYRADLWVEFKYAKNHGRNGFNIGVGPDSMLSDRQKLWLERRWKNGHNACVIVGVPSDRTRGFVLESPDEWLSVVHKELFIPRLKYAAELAAYILSRIS